MVMKKLWVKKCIKPCQIQLTKKVKDSLKREKKLEKKL